MIFAGFLLSTLRMSASEPLQPSAAHPAALGAPDGLARMLFSEYLLHFEAVSILLLAALVGSFVLAKRERQP